MAAKIRFAHVDKLSGLEPLEVDEGERPGGTTSLMVEPSGISVVTFNSETSSEDFLGTVFFVDECLNQNKPNINGEIPV